MIKNFLKLNQTQYRVSHMYLDYKTKRIFAIGCIGKKLVFHTEIYDYFEYSISKYCIFHRVKKLSKSNQTQYGGSHEYLKCKTKTIFAKACLEKKLAFRTFISY